MMTKLRSEPTSFVDYLAWRLAALSLQPLSRYLDFLESFRHLYPGCLEADRGSLASFPEVQLALRELNLEFEWRRFQDYQKRGFEFVAPGRMDFPERLLLIPDPPRGLFLWGARAALDSQALAVVGSRDPSNWTLEWMESELPRFLRENPKAILVSGGARGVDQAAHRLSLRHGRPTVVFLPSGFDEIYPKSLLEWTSSVFASGGVFVTEYAPEMPMRKNYFRERNRLISGLSQATLILEARQKSGTGLTAKAAAEQGRALFVVPSHPRDSSYSGSLQLLSEGAVLLRDAQELTAFFRAELSFSYRDIKLQSSPSLQLSFDH